jgi:4,5-DOPA dioxygenase extradiol
LANVFPAIFFGHGNPMNAIMNNAYTDAWRRVAEEMARPQAILSSPRTGSCPGPA